MFTKQQDAVNKFWYGEQVRLQNGENVTCNWSPQQKADILMKNVQLIMETIQRHRAYSVSKYPHLAGNSDIIYPVTFNEHLNGWHGGNSHNSLPREPIKK